MAQTKVRFDRAVEGATNIVDSGTEGTKVATGTTAQRGSTTGQWRYNTTSGFFEGINTGGTISSLEPDPTITSVDDGEVDSASGGNQTIVITGANFTSGGTITFVGTSAEFDASTTTFDNTTQVTAVAPKSSFLNAQEPYKVKFTSATGKSGTSSTGLISVDNAPTFGVASGSLGTLANADRASSNLTSVTATDAEGDTITFSQLSGTLPTGITFNSDGTFSGTANAETSDTTYTFTIRATAGGKTSDRQYTITVNAPQAYAYSYTGSTQTWAKPTGVTSVTAYVWGAGGSGGMDGQNGGSGDSAGGSGGYAKAVIDVSSLSNLYLVVGEGGSIGNTNTNSSGAGGGLSGIFDGSQINQNQSILIGGSGGGGTGTVTNNIGQGGGGGGANRNGRNGIRDSRLSGEQSEGHGGTLTGGGSAGNSSSANQYTATYPTAGSTLLGGDGGLASTGNPTFRSRAFAQGGRGVNVDTNGGGWCGGAGGSGYFGGGGGTCGYSGGGGGGSGYADTSICSSIVGTDGSDGSSGTTSAPENTSQYYVAGIAVGGAGSSAGGNGRIVLVY